MITSPQIQSTLTSLGLDEREQKVYLALLEMGEALQLPLAKKVGIKRTSLRELLPSLIRRGVIVESVQGKRKYLVAADPSTLIHRLEAQTAAALESLPALLALQNQHTTKPQVFFYEGIEGVKQVYRKTLEVGKPLYSFVDVSAMDPELERWAIEEYVPEREQRQIIVKNIISDSPRQSAVIPNTRYRQNKLMPRESFPFSMEVAVFGEWVMMNHLHGTEPSSVLIKSSSLADTLKGIHQALWSLLS